MIHETPTTTDTTDDKVNRMDTSSSSSSPTTTTTSTNNTTTTPASTHIDIEQWRILCREHYNVNNSSKSSSSSLSSSSLVQQKQLALSQLINFSSQSQQFNTNKSMESSSSSSSSSSPLSAEAAAAEDQEFGSNSSWPSQNLALELVANLMRKQQQQQQQQPSINSLQWFLSNNSNNDASDNTTTTTSTTSPSDVIKNLNFYVAYLNWAAAAAAAAQQQQQQQQQNAMNNLIQLSQSYHNEFKDSYKHSVGGRGHLYSPPSHIAAPLCTRSDIISTPSSSSHNNTHYDLNRVNQHHHQQQDISSGHQYSNDYYLASSSLSTSPSCSTASSSQASTPTTTTHQHHQYPDEQTMHSPPSLVANSCSSSSSSSSSYSYCASSTSSLPIKKRHLNFCDHRIEDTNQQLLFAARQHHACVAKRDKELAPPATLPAVREKKIKRCPHVWQFCSDLLDSDRFNPSIIKWLDKDKGIFKIVKPDKVAELWGAQKNRRSDKKMSYEKMARGMRYSRREGFFKKLEKEKNKPNEYGKQLVFQFSEKVVKNLDWKWPFAL